MEIVPTDIMEQIRLSVERHLTAKARFVYLLGSAGSARFTAESDIDLAASFIKPAAFEEMAELRAAIESDLGKDADLTDLNAADPIYGRQVLETGRLIVNNDPEERLKWEVRQLGFYPDLKFSRKGIEAALLTRKKYA